MAKPGLIGKQRCNVRLTKTSGGSYGKAETISAGGKWRFCGFRPTTGNAEIFAQVHRDKGRKVKISPAASGHGYRIEAYIEKRRSIMVHASAAECIAAGVAPGPCNL
jgi:hypothetical protein